MQARSQHKFSVQGIVDSAESFGYIGCKWGANHAESNAESKLRVCSRSKVNDRREF